MKKNILFTLVSLISFTMFSQALEKQFTVTATHNSNIDSIWMNGDSINFITDNLLLNGHRLSTKNTSIYNILKSYDADQRAADGNDDYMFNDAFSKADVIWLPREVPWTENSDEAQYFIEGDVEIPAVRKLIFEVDAIIDVAGSLKGNYTLIDADVQQIFTISSNLSTEDYDWASSNVARPEWFGAVPFGQPFNTRDAVQKCVDVFKRNILLDGAIYFIEGTINLNSINTLKISPLTIIEVSAATPEDPLFKITKEPFMIEGGLISVPQGYHGWIFDVAIDKSDPNDRLPRFASTISNIIVRGFDQGNDYSGISAKGIRVRAAKETDYSYFSIMDKVEFFRTDTAIFLSGHPVSGMSNSWHWSNITIDGTMKGIILDNRAAGHVFTNLIIQPNTWQHQFDEAFIIDVNSHYNVFNGMIWDIPTTQRVIHLGPDAGNNWFSNFGHYTMYRDHVVDESAGGKGANTFSTATPFEATSPNAYNYFTMHNLSIGIHDGSSNTSPLTVKRDAINDQVPAIAAKKKTIATGNVLTGTGATVDGITIISQTTQASMNRGLGGGIAFLSKHSGSDTISPSMYTSNVMARIYARKDDTNPSNDNLGVLQFFTVGENSPGPTMTLRSSGFVGIGTVEPTVELEVNGDIKANNISTTSVSIAEVLSLTPLATPPLSPSNGDIYVGTDNHIYCYLNGTWAQLDN